MSFNYSFAIKTLNRRHIKQIKTIRVASWKWQNFECNYIGVFTTRFYAILVLMKLQLMFLEYCGCRSGFLGCKPTCRSSAVWGKKMLFVLKTMTKYLIGFLCVHMDAMQRWCGAFNHVFHLFCKGMPVPVGVMQAFVRMFLSSAPPGAPLTFPRRLSEDRPSRLASSVCHCQQPGAEMKDRVLAGFPTMGSRLLRLTYFFNLSFPSFIWNRYIA